MLILITWLTICLQKINRGAAGIASWFPSSHYAILAILFSVGLELIFALQRWVVLVAIAVVSIVALGVVLVGREERRVWQRTQIILPLLATFGLSGFALLLPTEPILHVYILGAGMILYFLLKHGAKQAYPLWNWAISLGIYFLNVAYLFGLRFHLYIPILAVLGVVSILTALLSIQALRRVADSVSDIILPVLAVSFVMTQVAWVLQYLPSHYLAQAGIMAAVYYSIFGLLSVQYTSKITGRNIAEYIGVGTLACLIIVIGAKW